jgi:hypothetical protein
MKRALVFLVLAGLLCSGGVLAQSGGGYDLSWSTVDGGGWSFSRGGGYTLSGTVGQPDAGLLRGGGYTLAGGYWGGASAVEYGVYLPVVMRNSP